MKKINYRKIYKKYYGPIPLDENGRTYDIHHINGNREDNRPENLVALSIKEHSKCVAHKIASPTLSNIVVACGGGGGTLSHSTRVEVDSIETNDITIKLDKKPNIVVRWLYKLLNIKWK